MAEPSLRILLVAPASSGGIGGHVRDLAGGLRGRGRHVTVAAPAATLATFDLAAIADAVVALPIGTARPAVFARLRRLARSADVVHAHGVRAGAAAAFAAAGAPLVVTWHNAPLGGRLRRAVHAALERVCARRADRILVASADLLERARRAGAVTAELVPVASPPPTARTAGDGEAAVDLRSLAAGRLVVVCVARLHPQKRVDLLVSALAGQGELHAFVAGDGPLRDRLERQIGASRAPVTLLGRRGDVAALYAQADLAVLPSDWEARPLAVQEALRAGVPTVCTDVGGVADLVGDAAVVVPPGDAEALRAALLGLAADPQRRAALAAAGVHQAAGWPTVDNTVDSVDNIYLNLYSRRR